VKVVHAVVHRNHYRNWMTKVAIAIPWISAEHGDHTRGTRTLYEIRRLVERTSQRGIDTVYICNIKVQFVVPDIVEYFWIRD